MTNNQLILISVVHFLYYLYVLMIVPITRIGTIYNTKNREVNKLRREFGIKITTFRKNGNLLGFAKPSGIYLNERLFKKKGNIRKYFYHEYYHHTHKHYQWNIIMRSAFGMIPMLAIFFNQWIVLSVYVISAYLLYYIKENIFESNAWKYANKRIDEEQ